MAFDTYQDSEYGGAPLLMFRFYSGPRAWHYTNQKTKIEDGSETYAPIPISIGPTEQSAQEAPRGVEINLPSSDPLALEFKPFLPPQPIEVDVYTRQRGDATNENRPVFIGEVGACNFNEDGTATLTCYPLQHRLQRVIPWPVYCTNCNWAVYSHGCGVDKLLFKAEGVVDAVSENIISAAAFGAHDDDWFSKGYVVRELTGDVRWILAHAGSQLILVAPFPSLANGEAVTAYAGCDGLESTCKDKFNNLPNHAGFGDVPRKNPFTEDVFGTSSGGSGAAASPNELAARYAKSLI